MNKLDLLTGGFQHSCLMARMPLFDAIYHDGRAEAHTQLYTLLREDQECALMSLSVIRKDEKVIWESARDLLARSVREAAAAVRGVYTFELLTFDVHKEKETFNFNELSSIILNASRKIKPGERRLVRYCSAYGILQKMVHEDWGKIVFKPSIEVFNDKPVFLDLLIKRLLKKADFSHRPFVFLLHDLSANPVFDSENSDQQERVRKVIDKQTERAIEHVPEVYIQDKNGIRELLSGMTL